MKIISGGQSGVDRAALDAAIDLSIVHGGWCPKGRLSEIGAIPTKYNLQETDSEKYEVRTEKNILVSDGTLVFVPKLPITVTDGTNLTIELAKKYNKPCLVIDLSQEIDLNKIVHWIEMLEINELNIAGPRESQAPGINKLTYDLMLKLFTAVLKKLEINEQQKDDVALSGHRAKL